MNLSASLLFLLCACCWVAVVLARTGRLGGKREAGDNSGARVLRGALDKRDVPDVRNVRRLRDVLRVRDIKVPGRRPRRR